MPEPRLQVADEVDEHGEDGGHGGAERQLLDHLVRQVGYRPEQAVRLLSQEHRALQHY